MLLTNDGHAFLTLWPRRTTTYIASHFFIYKHRIQREGNCSYQYLTNFISRTAVPAIFSIPPVISLVPPIGDPHIARVKQLLLVSLDRVVISFVYKHY